MDLPIIILSHTTENIISQLFRDPRTYLIVFINGFVTTFAVVIANSIKERISLLKVKKEERKHEQEIKELKERINKLEEKRR